VQIKAGTLLFLETDKPIYKPGQTIRVRLVALDSELKPVQTQATVEVQDAKGIKVFKQTLATDEFGTVTTELPLSTEPNLGVWKLNAAAGDTSTDLDIRVEKYVLPKYEVKADLAKTWFLVDEPITGHVAAQYSFGKQVRGELKITASRYVGTWEEFATYSAPIDGEGDFSIQPAGYVAGVPEAGGLGNVRLDVAVAERATGQHPAHPREHRVQTHSALRRRPGDRDARRRAGRSRGHRGHQVHDRGLSRSGA
jgi:CD109 antigen